MTTTGTAHRLTASAPARRTAAVLLSRGVVEPHPTTPDAFQLTADTAERIAR